MLVYMFLTDDCNLNCSFCYQNKKFSGSCSIQDSIDFIDTIEQKELVIFGGEPLLKKNTVHKILKNSSYSKATITTNGVLLDESFINELNDKTYIQISLENTHTIPIYNNKNIFYHMTISSDNVKNVVRVKEFYKDIWFSVDRQLKFEINIPHIHGSKYDNFIKCTGKNCKALDNEQILINCINGDIYPCGSLMYLGEKYKLGNIKSKDIKTFSDLNIAQKSCVSDCEVDVCRTCTCIPIATDDEHLNNCKAYTSLCD